MQGTGMNLVVEERLSDAPLVERIWRSHSGSGGFMTSVAASNWELVAWKESGKTHLAVRGPETHPTRVPVPEDSESFGIIFKHGTFMPHLPIIGLVNGAVKLPEASSRSFWLKSAAWEIPSYDNADTFVDRLVRSGLLVRETIVSAALEGQLPDLSARSLQRRILRATGLNSNAIRQIVRARQAAILLREGTPILDTVYQLGYADQAHLTRALKHLIGQTPAQIADIRNAEQLSLLFKTTLLW
jgi:hypothetical protein